MFERWCNEEGLGEIILGSLATIFRVVNSIFAVILASRIVLILESIQDYHKAFLHILAIVSLYTLLRVLEAHFTKKRSVSTSCYRLMETPQLFIKLMNIPFKLVEGSSG